MTLAELELEICSGHEHDVVPALARFEVWKEEAAAVERKACY